MANAEVTITPVWRNVDATLRDKVVAFWQEHNIADGTNIEARLENLAAVAQLDGKIVGTATSPIFPWEPIDSNCFLFRCFVSPAHRQTGIATRLFNDTYDHLHEWADANKDSQVDAMLFFSNAAETKDKNKNRVWKNTGLIHTGYRQDGTPVYLRYFLRGGEPRAVADEIEIRNVWQNVTPQAGEAILKMWEANNALPPGTDPQERLQNTVCVAFKGDEAVGVLTVGTGTLDIVRASMFLVRVFVAEQHRSHKLPRRLSRAARPILHEWIRQNPQSGIEGIATIIQAAVWQNRPDLRRPRSPEAFARAGTTSKGYPVRLAWTHTDHD